MTLAEGLANYWWIGLVLVFLSGLALGLFLRTRRIKELGGQIEELAWRVEQVEMGPGTQGGLGWSLGRGPAEETGGGERSGDEEVPSSSAWAKNDLGTTSEEMAQWIPNLPGELDRGYAWIHGEALGDPGPGAVGVILKNGDGKLLASLSEPIARSSDPMTRFQAMIIALEQARKFRIRKVTVHTHVPSVRDELLLDRQTVHDQASPAVRTSRSLIHSFIKKFEEFQILVVPADENRDAIGLARAVFGVEKPV